MTVTVDCLLCWAEWCCGCNVVFVVVNVVLVVVLGVDVVVVALAIFVVDMSTLLRLFGRF